MAVIDNLVAYWSFDEASGNAIDDHSTHDGVETGGTIASTTGKVGNARDFEAGDTEWFEVADNAAFDVGTGDFSVAFWINIESAPGNAEVLSRQNSSSPFAGYAVLHNSGRQIIVQTSDGTLVANTNTGAITLATWTHVVVTRAGADIIVYLNAVAGTTMTGRSGSLDNDRPVHIGAFNGASNFYDGLLDELGLWTKALTQAEIDFLYAGGAGVSYADIVAEAAGGMLKRHPGMSGGFRDMVGGLNG